MSRRHYQQDLGARFTTFFPCIIYLEIFLMLCSKVDAKQETLESCKLCQLFCCHPFHEYKIISNGVTNISRMKIVDASTLLLGNLQEHKCLLSLITHFSTLCLKITLKSRIVYFFSLLLKSTRYYKSNRKSF